MKIMVVETNLKLINDITFTLNNYQPFWMVSAINSGKECLNIIKNDKSLDIIIIGIKLSDMSGFELTGYIRNDSDTPILIVSSDSNIRTLVRALLLCCQRGR